MRFFVLVVLTLGLVGGCHSRTASTESCFDLMRNQDESDVDCGGFVCMACGAGRACIEDHDCTSGQCSAGVCATASCDDGVKNGSESDIDCGGPGGGTDGGCPRCDTGHSCGGNNDCASFVCSGRFCAAAACNDGFQNGGETGVDCGGPCPPCDAA